MSIQRSMLMSRLKAAYEANNIPVDTRTQAIHKSLSTHCLLENTLYWEAKARGVNANDAITTAEALALLAASRSRSDSPGGTRSLRSYECVRLADLQYHGSAVD